jgi:hypothetical protein
MATWLHGRKNGPGETFHWFRGEGFGLIVEDLLRFPAQPRVLVEGSGAPALISPAGTGGVCSCWQPRLPDPSYASPALEVVTEDKSGAALA